MMYIGDLLNKLRWDKNLKPKEYTLVYFDRVLRKEFEIPFTSIGRKANFFIINLGDREVMVPLHRINKVKRSGKVIWER